jgi:hypothetical protein
MHAHLRFEQLPTVQPTFEWIRLAQRIPVMVRIDKVSDKDCCLQRYMDRGRDLGGGVSLAWCARLAARCDPLFRRFDVYARRVRGDPGARLAHDGRAGSGGRGIPGAGAGGASVTRSASLTAITTMLVLIFVLRFVAQAEGMRWPARMRVSAYT